MSKKVFKKVIMFSLKGAVDSPMDHCLNRNRVKLRYWSELELYSNYNNSYILPSLVKKKSFRKSIRYLQSFTRAQNISRYFLWIIQHGGHLRKLSFNLIANNDAKRFLKACRSPRWKYVNTYQPIKDNFNDRNFKVISRGIQYLANLRKLFFPSSKLQLKKSCFSHPKIQQFIGTVQIPNNVTKLWPSLQKLSLNLLHSGENSQTYFFRAISDLNKLQDLDIQMTNCTNKGEFSTTLCDLISKDHLQSLSLSLSNCIFTDLNYNNLFKTIAASTSLEKLRVHFDRVSLENGPLNEKDFITSLKEYQIPRKVKKFGL